MTSAYCCVLLQVLGYDNHAAYVLETRMAKSPANVLKFLSDLETKLGPGAAKGPRAGFERRVSSFCLVVHVILAVCPVCIPLWLTVSLVPRVCFLSLMLALSRSCEYLIPARVCCFVATLSLSMQSCHPSSP